MADTKTTFPKYTRLQVRTPTGVARFPMLTPGKPDSYKGIEKYKTAIVFDGDADTSALTAAALKIAAEVWPTRKADKVNVLIKDGDEAEKDGEPIQELAGKTYMTVSSGVKFPPQIVGPDRKPLPAGMEIRGGDLIKLVLSPMPSDTPVKGTVTFRLLAVQLIEKRSGGGDFSSLFDEEGEGFGAAKPDSEPSTGADAGGFSDDDDLPF